MNFYASVSRQQNGKCPLFPLSWLSIEALKTFRFSMESDIWAFGVTMWEIFSLSETPYSPSSIDEHIPDDKSYCKFLLDFLESGKRMSKPFAANETL
jgi:serine/threonine protein kinase